MYYVREQKCSQLEPRKHHRLTSVVFTFRCKHVLFPLCIFYGKIIYIKGEKKLTANLIEQGINFETINRLYSGSGELPDLSKIVMPDGTVAIDSIRDFIRSHNCEQVSGAILLPAADQTIKEARGHMRANLTDRRPDTFCGPFFHENDEYVPTGMAIYTHGTNRAIEA